jgi:hypothetical protein
MLVRECDRCKTKMLRGKPFIKVVRSYMYDSTQKLEHIGDICEDCWDEIKVKKK